MVGERTWEQRNAEGMKHAIDLDPEDGSGAPSRGVKQEGGEGGGASGSGTAPPPQVWLALKR